MSAPKSAHIRTQKHMLPLVGRGEKEEEELAPQEWPRSRSRDGRATDQFYIICSYILTQKTPCTRHVWDVQGVFGAIFSLFSSPHPHPPPRTPRVLHCFFTALQFFGRAAKIQVESCGAYHTLESWTRVHFSINYLYRS